MFELACFPDFPKLRVVWCGRMDFSVILRSWSVTPGTVDEESAHFPSEIIVKKKKNSLCIYTIHTLTKHKLDGYNFTVISRNRKKNEETLPDCGTASFLLLLSSILQQPFLHLLFQTIIINI